MLITRRDEGLVLVTQPDHAEMAGDIAAHWGGDVFAKPPHHDGLITAAALHDDGWLEADDAPLMNADEARPLHFLEIDMEDHIGLYGRGVDRTFGKDPYAGLLVSMHWTGLYRGRWGMQEGRLQWSEGTRIDVLQSEAVEKEERRWIEVKRDLIRDEPRTDFESGLWHNYDVLQALDQLSLFICLLPLVPADGDGVPIPVPQTLKSIEQEPADRTITSVPVAVGGERVDLTLRAVEPGVVTVDPYPFDEPSVEFSVPAKIIADRRYEDADDAHRAIDGGEEMTITCRMTKG